ncbi:MAG: murein L,D-transpeptidase catalytic domain-containing protein, partial [Arenimonas sp.]
EAKQKGRLGRSWGCPAVRPEVAQAVIDSLKNGQMIFSYYPDNNWLARSPFIDCRRKGSVASL